MKLNELPTEQVGGDHYRKMGIDVFKYAMENGLDALQFSIIKYVSRFRDKGGMKDLQKAANCLYRLIEFEEERQRRANETPKESAILATVVEKGDLK